MKKFLKNSLNHIYTDPGVNSVFTRSPFDPSFLVLLLSKGEKLDNKITKRQMAKVQDAKDHATLNPRVNFRLSC